MKLIKSERGAVLLYVLLLIVILITLSVPLMNMAVTRSMHDTKGKNERIATSLAVNTAEEYIAYLKRCTNCTPSTYYKALKFNGTELSDSRRVMKIRLADGNPVTLTMYTEEVEPDPGEDTTWDRSIVIRAVAGDTNFDGEAKDKFSAQKTIRYKINTIGGVNNRLLNPRFSDPGENRGIITSESLGGEGEYEEAFNNLIPVESAFEPPVFTNGTALLNHIKNNVINTQTRDMAFKCECPDVGLGRDSDYNLIKPGSPHKLVIYITGKLDLNQNDLHMQGMLIVGGDLIVNNRATLTANNVIAGGLYHQQGSQMNITVNGTLAAREIRGSINNPPEIEGEQEEYTYPPTGNDTDPGGAGGFPWNPQRE